MANTWPMTVRDAHRHTHRGEVVFASSRATSTVRKGCSFCIVLLPRPADVAVDDGCVACCVPAAAVRVRTAVSSSPGAPLSLSAEASRAYRGGRIVTGGSVVADTADIFPSRGGQPRLRALARALVDAHESEGVATYAAIIRHELRLAPGADALAALRLRLRPARAADRPSPRAPAVRRLTRVLRDLAAHRVPEASLEQLADDCRFLGLFEATGWTPDAAARLLADIGGTARLAGRGRAEPAARALRVVPRGAGR